MKTLLLILLATFPVYAHSQKRKEQINISKYPIFTGIGIFKIGSDTTTLINYANLNTDFIRDIDDVMYFIDFQNDNKANNKSGLIRLKRNKIEYYSSAKSRNPLVTEYYLTNYIISGIELKSISLKYYKNKLIEFNCDPTLELTESLDTKYGKAKFSSETEKVGCLFKLTGIVRQLEAKSFYYSWGKSPILTTYSIWDTYDDHCEKTTHQQFYYKLEVKELNDWELSHPYSESKPKKDLKDF